MSAGANWPWAPYNQDNSPVLHQLMMCLLLWVQPEEHMQDLIDAMWNADNREKLWHSGACR